MVVSGKSSPRRVFLGSGAIPLTATREQGKANRAPAHTGPPRPLVPWVASFYSPVLSTRGFPLLLAESNRSFQATFTATSWASKGTFCLGCRGAQHWAAPLTSWETRRQSGHLLTCSLGFISPPGPSEDEWGRVWGTAAFQALGGSLCSYVGCFATCHKPLHGPGPVLPPSSRGRPCYLGLHGVQQQQSHLSSSAGPPEERHRRQKETTPGRRARGLPSLPACDTQRQLGPCPFLLRFP